MAIKQKTAAVFGGTGFIGRQVVRELAKHNYIVKVVSRVPERAYFLKPCGDIGQVVPLACDYSQDKDLEAAIRGCDVVVNCIGILFEKGKRSFTRTHVDLPRRIAEVCTKQKVQRFVHISALGCDVSRSKYARSKKEGEEAVLDGFPKATILRPSIVFGEDDDFFNKFAKLSLILPAFPLIGGGHTRFQPVFVGNVADAVITAAIRAAVGENNPQGQIYELGGPDIVTFREIYEILARHTRRKRTLMPIPFPLAKIQGAFFGLMPEPLLTMDQVESLKTDNIVQKNAKTLYDLDINTTSMDLILPQYLESYRSGGRFANAKAS